MRTTSDDDLAAFWKTNIWVYVGCGMSGLADPDFGLLLERYGERARRAGHWDYCLVRNGQRDEFQACFESRRLNICAVPFGKDHADLPEYLRSLLPLPEPATEPATAAVAPNTSDAASTRPSRILSDFIADLPPSLTATRPSSTAAWP